MYILDTNSIRVLGNYYPDVFPTFWSQMEAVVADGTVSSVREVRKEIELQDASEHVGIWVASNPLIFPTPAEAEMEMVAEIFRIPHFQQLIGEKQRLRGQPVADPFIVARASVLSGCVVTEEVHKPNGAKIPNVCEHFTVDCCNMKEFLSRLGWRY